MSAAVRALTNDEARQVFLAAHLLAHDPARHGAPLADTVERLGFVQLDSIRTVARAHDHILLTRDRRHADGHLTRAQEEGALFEHWTHDASIIPMRFYPHWQHRFVHRKRRIADNAWWAERLGSRRILTAIVKRIEAAGPLRARDFEDKDGRSGAWWGWGRSKAALEYLWHTGRLAIASRDGFEKIYDLAERVVPEAARAAKPSRAAHVDWACRAALERLGFATAKEIAAFWALIGADDADVWIKRNAKDLETVIPHGTAGQALAPAVALRGTIDRLLREPFEDQMRAINPFDPAIRDRSRLKALFGFDYRIEIFVPAAKRRYGYYVYPLLDGTRFAGRIDMKADREAGSLCVTGLWLETGYRDTKGFRARLRPDLEALAGFAGAGRIDWDLKAAR
jgi:uncharacterized protein YcaQ